eukprot:TRINITY_DN1176_c1_g1_i1.p1 TRINITY_DN1176_c1_g1~~TRINITY_DN1176_c1_g1_i1.p1  ORF type:complete len:240 (+),score=39.62 TRINITY_DN1176_c1_g1_i1:95-814(+)
MVMDLITLLVLLMLSVLLLVLVSMLVLMVSVLLMYMLGVVGFVLFGLGILGVDGQCSGWTLESPYFDLHQNTPSSKAGVCNIFNDAICWTNISESYLNDIGFWTLPHHESKTVECDCEVQSDSINLLYDELLQQPLSWAVDGCYYFQDAVAPCTLQPVNTTLNPVDKYITGINITISGYYRRINGMTGWTTVITRCSVTPIGFSANKPAIFTQIVTISSSSKLLASLYFIFLTLFISTI